jgi:hypothetical protein
MSRFAFLFTLMFAGSAWAERSAVAVLDIQGTGLDPNLLPTLTEVLTVEINDLGMYKVVAGRDVQAMLGFEKQKDMLGCTDAACLAEIGGALGVDRIVVSQITKVGSTYVVNIKIINIRTADAEGRVYETVKGEVDALIETIKKSVVKLLGSGSKAAVTLTPSAKPAETVAKATPKPAEIKPVETKPVETKPVDTTTVAQVAEPAPQLEAKGGGRTIGWLPMSLWGAGAVGCIGGAIFGMTARGKASDATASNEVNGTKVYLPGTQVKAQDAKKLATISTIFWAVGGAAAIGGTAAWFFSGSSDGAQAALAPVYTGDSVGFALSGQF